MISIERILCPASLPHESEEALAFAASLVRAFNSKLFLCHYADAPALVTVEANGTAQVQTRKLLEDSFARHLERSPARELYWKRVVVGYGKDAGEEIVREAGERRIDLIVMRSRYSRVAGLLGSTAEHVSRTAPCPVLIIRSKENMREGEQNGTARFKRVLVSHDFSTSSELALSYALAIAQKYLSEVHLMHVLPKQQTGSKGTSWNQAGMEGAYLSIVRRLRDVVPGEVYLRCKVVNVVRWGKPYREVLAYTRQQNIDLVCMGALGLDFGSEALFGSNADRVLRQAPSHVLIARPLRSGMVVPPMLNFRRLV